MTPRGSGDGGDTAVPGAPPGRPLAAIKGFLVDLDGVVWIGESVAPGAVAFWEHAVAAGIPLAFVTNSSAYSRAGVERKLRHLGIAAGQERVFSAARAAAVHVAARGAGTRAFVLGEAGIVEELELAGVEIVERGADVVVVGVDRALEFARLRRACQEVLAGAELVATSADRNFPTEDGPTPAAGAFAAFVGHCAGRPPLVVGKPEPPVFEQALAYLCLAPSEAAMIGDNPASDIAGARRVGLTAILVGEQPLGVPPELTPNLDCRDLGEVLALLQAER